jgi:hypothetical protein
MKVFSIWLGDVEASQVEELLTNKAKELGYKFLLERHKELRTLIDNASADEPCDISDERELQEVEFMLSTYQDYQGYPDPDKLDF